jgi:hypothetical protein
MGKAREVVMFMCGRMTPQALQAFKDLVRQAPDWLDVAVVGYSVEPKPARYRVGLRWFKHHLYDARDLTGWAFPAKAAVEPHEFKLIPGNTDLIHLRFAVENPQYERYWWVEDDVRFGGNWADLFNYLRPSTAGLIGTTIRRPEDDPKWHWWGSLGGPQHDPIACFIPFGAVTGEAVDAILGGYHEGFKGHYEGVWPTVIARQGLGLHDIGGAGPFVPPGDENRFYTNTGQQQLAPGTFVWRPYHTDYDRTGGQIWHPIREEPGGVHAT